MFGQLKHQDTLEIPKTTEQQIDKLKTEQPLKLKLSLEIDLSETKKEDGTVIARHLGAFIKEINFNESVKPLPGKKFVNSGQLQEIAPLMWANWISLTKINKEENKEENNAALNKLQFEAPTPPQFLPNIAICYQNKFNENNAFNGTLDEKKLQRAKQLIGKNFEMEFSLEDLKLIFNNTNKNYIENLKKITVINKNQGKVQIIPTALSGQNAGANLFNLQLSGENAEAILKLATEVIGEIKNEQTGEINAELTKANALPTNSQKEKIPFSFTAFKLPNFIALVNEALENNENQNTGTQSFVSTI